MEENATCAICGEVIDVGQAWMEADQEGTTLRAHAECVYREPGDAGTLGWRPMDRSADR
jgi:hypothetical protein